MFWWKFSQSTVGIKPSCGEKITNIEDFNLARSKWVNDKYKAFYEKHGYLPEFFDVYNGTELKNIAPTLSTRSNGAMGSGTVLIIIEDFYKSRPMRIYEDYALCLRSERTGLKVGIIEEN